MPNASTSFVYIGHTFSVDIKIMVKITLAESMDANVVYTIVAFLLNLVNF